MNENKISFNISEKIGIGCINIFALLKMQDPIKFSHSMEPKDESWLRENKDKVFWIVVSRYQNLSKEFIMEMFEYIHFGFLLFNSNISEETKNYIRMFI